MANVLNKITKVFLQSVNTPEYPESDWIINPDLSAVAGIPACYWKVQQREVVDVPAYDTVDEETQETTHYDAVTHIEYDVVEMSAEEKAVVDAQSVVKITNRLADGTLAYLYKDHVVSVNVSQLVFAVKSIGAKKFTVPFQAAHASFDCDRNRLITSVGISTEGSFDLVLKIDNVEKLRLSVGQDRSFPGLEQPLLAGESLSLAIEASEPIANPVITVDTNYID